MKQYNHKDVEKKWKKTWEQSGIYKTKEEAGKPKYYVLDMFPYPSGAGLHVGHPKGYIATDIVGRMKMMQGYNVLHPMGWDAFGLPAENYAIKNKVHPAEATAENVATFKKQLGLLGFTYDWDREVNTTDPKYYKWTQWIFLQLFKKGLAYESFAPINWCPSCQTGLANEDLDDGKCERCGSEIERKPMRQWVLKITDYAEKLLDGLDKLPLWPEHIKKMQSDWIGRSEGALVDFKIKDSEEILKIFTTRPDTLFGATYMVVAPEHPLVVQNLEKISNKKEVQEYLDQAKSKSDLERTELQKEKNGVELKGVKAINPLNGAELPIFVADYVLYGYGTGAIMAVPGHDERDWEFAKKYNLSILAVVSCDSDVNEKPFTSEGVAINSDFLNNLSTPEAKKKIIEYLQEKGLGQKKIQYKLRDWVFSRQRYWGEPMPLVHCENCKNKKQKVLMIHGFEGNGEGSFLPWIKQELEKNNFEVFNPTMSTAAHPDLEQWMKELMPYIEKMDENDIVIGHSLGSKAALHLLERSQKKIKNLYLIASAIGEMNERDWDLYRTSWVGSDVEALKKFWETPLDFSKITNLADEVKVVLSDDDPWIKKKTHENLPKEWSFELWSKFGHFNVPSNPKLLDLFLKSKNTGWVPVPENQLPLELPKVKNYEPSGTGESPLATITNWVNTTCPQCDGPAKRETNTMPQWAGSCWYYLAYTMPKDAEGNYDWDKKKINYWNPIDLYVGGAEHATRHLIYARFWHKFLFDIGAVANEEPFTRLQNVGLILAEDGRKMSKRWNNVINPDQVVEEYGADSMRLYEMFMGPFDQSCAWSTKGVVGVRRFLERVWTLNEKISDSAVSDKKLTAQLHQTIKKVSEDIEGLRFNTAISCMMQLSNEMGKAESITKEDFSVLLKLLSPFAPHMMEELWNEAGNKESIFESAWPQYNAELAKDEEITLAVQVNGKLRDTLTVSADISEEEAKAAVLASEKIQKWLEGKEPKKIIYVKGKLISIVL